MPTAAPKPCVVCQTLVTDGGQRCQAHARKVWSKYADAPKRVTGRRLQAQRHALFSREPLCRLCAQRGLATVATIRDHIVPLAEGGTDDDTNIQPICAACDEVKSAAERLRARGLGPTAAAVAPAEGRGGQIPGGRPAETGRYVGFSCAQVSEKFS